MGKFPSELEAIEAPYYPCRREIVPARPQAAAGKSCSLPARKETRRFSEQSVNTMSCKNGNLTEDSSKGRQMTWPPLVLSSTQYTAPSAAFNRNPTCDCANYRPLQQQRPRIHRRLLKRRGTFTDRPVLTDVILAAKTLL